MNCELPDCDKPRYQRQRMCGSHFMKAYRHGDPYYKAPIPHTDITGQRFGSLTAQERVNGRWNCACDCGATTTVRIGDLKNGNAKSCGNPKIHRRSESPTYEAVHERLRRDRGPARAQHCVDCGKRAAHWSYDHADTAELVGERDGLRRPYSLDQQHYQPRCVPCHKRLDLDRLALSRTQTSPGA